MFAQNPELVVALCVAAWLGCGIIGSGFYNAYFQRKWPEIRADADLYKSLALSIFGPIHLLLAILINGTYGWSLKRDAVKGWGQQ